MADTTKLLVEAARDSVQDITERYHGYHARLIDRFTEILRIQRDEANEVATRSIGILIASFANEVAAQRRSAPE